MSKAQFGQSKLALTGQQPPSPISSDEWYTPIDIIQRVHKMYGDLCWLDIASNEDAQTTIKADRFFTKDNSALGDLASWQSDAIWMNPPYSRKMIGQFVDRFIEELDNDSFKQAIVLVNSCTETKWFYRLAIKADVRIDIQGRLHFWHPDKPSTSPISGSTLFYYGELWDEFLIIFGDLGLCYERTAMR